MMSKYDIYKTFTNGHNIGREEFTAERTATAVGFHFLYISEPCILMMAISYSRNM